MKFFITSRDQPDFSALAPLRHAGLKTTNEEIKQFIEVSLEEPRELHDVKIPSHWPREEDIQALTRYNFFN